MIRIPAPKNYSLINNPAEIIGHINHIGKISSRNTFLVSDLSFIKEFTPDAIVAMFAFANDREFSNGGRIDGISPADPGLAEKFANSGIFGETKFKFSDGLVRRASGKIKQITNKSVKADVAQDLVHFTTERIFGEVRPLKGVYSTMIECMTNTHNWADDRDQGKEAWWAAVYCDTSNGIAYFNFVDTGIGILESVRIKLRDRVRRFFGVIDNATLMREVLEGDMGSRSQLEYRGNGLPAIVRGLKRGHYKNLIIIANDVYANVSKDEYRVLPVSFKGTFFHWEVSNDRDIDE